MKWSVEIVGKARKQYRALPKGIKDKARTLMVEIEVAGPIRGNWKNYSKLAQSQHHCHLQGRHPTYVACWREVGERRIEVYYVGTHEKAPY